MLLFDLVFRIKMLGIRILKIVTDLTCLDEHHRIKQAGIADT